jgi:ABC-type uncharacterized transport system substrate-binding protein
MKKILNGIIALLVVAGVLLISDLNNRKTSESARASLKGRALKLCFVHYSETAISEEAEKGVHDELAKQGLVEGKDFTLKVMSAQGDMATLNSIAEAVSSEKWDLIFTASTPTLQVFIKKIKTVPVVFTNSGDPIGAGVGESFEKHLPNFTGISTLSDFDGMVSLVVETLPGITTIGTIYTPGEINSVKYAEELKKSATAKGLKVVTVPANSATEVNDASLAIVGQGVEAITQIADNLTASCSDVIIKQAYKQKIPYFGFISSQLEKGAVATLARDYHQAGVDAVQLAMKILKGKSPAEIPIQYVSRTTLMVNHEAENFFGVKVPEKWIEK